MVDLKQIKELMTAMKDKDIKKIHIKEKSGFELVLESSESAREHHTSHHHPVYHPGYVQAEHYFHPHAAHAPHRQAPLSHESPSSHSEKKEEKEGKYVVSPMVGTFYASPSPDDPHFVKVGDRVEENSVVCIIEAMKVMNEVKAGVSGVIAEIYIDNAHAVEFGTKLFRIV